VAGLLASGHYTEIATYASGHPITEPRLKCHTIDWENYKKAIPPRIRPFYVIDDAESLLNDIEFIVKQEGGNCKELTPSMAPKRIGVIPHKYLKTRHDEWERIAKALGDKEPECSDFGWWAGIIETHSKEIRKIIERRAK
jgi:hypothetical protein